jgi:hypothetical protein
LKADAHPLKLIFGRDIRYVVPLYQRPYVWDLETKWEPLWEDVRLLVAQVLAAGPDESVAPHFLGAIVLDAQKGPLRDIEARYLIDGQQRLTTLQLLMGAAAHIADESKIEQPARLLRRLSINDVDLVGQGDQQFKVWPTTADQEAFRAVMTGQAVPQGANQRIVDAYKFFRASIVDWISDNGATPTDRFDGLVKALRDHLKIVVIDLDDEDNAQVIFETLNARTTPLLAVDLVKNLAFRKAETEKADVAALYKEYWKPFDEDAWRKEVRQGRLKRPKAEIFLMHWLTMKREEETAADQLYPSFKKLLDRPDAPSVVTTVQEFAADSQVFTAWEALRAHSYERLFFERLASLEVTTIYPLLLDLFRQPENVLARPRRTRGLKLLESWLVRRMLCRLTTKNYNRYFLELLKAVRKDPAHTDDVLHEQLTIATAETNLWPEDAQLRDTLVNRSLYWQVAGHRIVMVLGAIEMSMRTNKSEAIDLPLGLTIEHILPQKWERHWKVDPRDTDAVTTRWDHVHRLGNLTLVTGALNPSTSNREWKVKREALRKHSLLLLSKELVDENRNTWDETKIDARSDRLAELIVKIWPGPNSPAWKRPSPSAS